MEDWLPSAKHAALCFSIDDLHPAKSSGYYEAGGDLGSGALAHLEWLLARHPQLHVTLFVTADWMEIAPFPTRRIAAIPFVRDRVYLADHWRAGTMRLDRHIGFVHFLRNLPRTEVALHGLHHLARGLHLTREFEALTRAQCTARVKQMIRIFRAADLDFVPGLCPPGWSAPNALLDAMVECGLRFLASARDVQTPITGTAQTSMSGLRGVSLLHPEYIHHGQLLHVPTNWQGDSSVERARAIIASGGLLSIKAHIVKYALGYVSQDGLDSNYRNSLDELFTRLDAEFGDALWWTSMGEISARYSSPETTNAT